MITSENYVIYGLILMQLNRIGFVVVSISI
jgi:hypothetical protein